MKISNVYVPSEGDPSKAKLWIIGEAPGNDETYKLRPFVGKSGQLLDDALANLGVDRKDVFITNLCHYQPEKNNFELLRGSAELSAGLTELIELLRNHNPNCLLLFGNQPLELLTQRKGITKWRGSTLSVSLGNKVIKAIPSYHPAYILRVANDWPVFLCDVEKAIKESKSPEVTTSDYTIHIEPDAGTFVNACNNATLLGVDIETVKKTTKILCIGFAVSPNEAYVIPLFNNKLEDVLAVTEVLQNNIPKVFHNGIFDVCVLRLNEYEVNNYAYDTIIGANLLAPELEKSLAFLTSIYTNQPYYKEEGRANLPSDTKGWSAKRDKKELYIYNAKDCCVTYQICVAQLKELAEQNLLDFYLNYQMPLQREMVELSLRGMYIDEERRNLLKNAVEKKRDEVQNVLNFLAYKLSNEKVKSLNVGSTKVFPEFLYDTLGLPARYSKPKPGKAKTLTADEDAIVASIAWCKGKIEDSKLDATKMHYIGRLKLLELTLKIREYNKQLSSYLKVVTNSGRVKSTFKVHGTETGRLSAAKFVDDSGLNLQTIPRDKVEV